MKSKLKVFLRCLINLDFTDAIDEGVKGFAKTYQSDLTEPLPTSQREKTGKGTESVTTFEKIEKDPTCPR